MHPGLPTVAGSPPARPPASFPLWRVPAVQPVGHHRCSLRPPVSGPFLILLLSEFQSLALCTTQGTSWILVWGLDKSLEPQTQNMEASHKLISRLETMIMCSVVRWCLTLRVSVDRNLTGCSIHGISLGRNTGAGCHFLLQYSIQNPGNSVS